MEAPSALGLAPPIDAGDSRRLLSDCHASLAAFECCGRNPGSLMPLVMSALANAPRRSASANSEERAVMVGLPWPIAI